MNNHLRYGLLLVVAILMSRALFLEYSDLVDPTEARYASVAQHMVLSGDWTIPRLPMAEGIIPYQSKPPLHYWLTAVSYSVFGMDEWSARLPSVFSAGLILLGIWLVGRKLFSHTVAVSGALIAVSSVLLFFLAGASVTDVTLTACTTLATGFAYMFLRDGQQGRQLIWLSSFFCALGFLCKGPVALVLVVAPLFFWSLNQKDFTWLKRIPWISGLGVFFLIAAPWFVVNEMQNPGFLKYYFWNENIARYLIKDYGDRYGYGHVHTYGTSWLMMAGAFLPWTVVLILQFFISGPRETWKWLKDDKDRVFIFFWALSAPLFFTFVRQLHIMYILPAIPGAALFTALLLHEQKWARRVTYIPENLMLYIAGFLWIGFLVGSIATHNESFAVLVTTFTIVVAFCLLKMFVLKKIKAEGNFVPISFYAALWSATYLVILASATPYLDRARSTENILSDFAMMSDSGDGKIAVISESAFSPYWVAGAWQEELAKPVQVSYVNEDKILSSNMLFFLIKAKSEKDVPAEIQAGFDLIKEIKPWRLYKRRAPGGSSL